VNIYQRINAVREEVTYIRKDKKVSTGGEGGYKAVTHDAVVAYSRQSLVKNGVIILPSLVSEEMEAPLVKIKDGEQTTSSMRLYKARFDVTFVNADDPQDKFTVNVPAHALDSGDKAPGKAITYATKAAILKVLLLETGEDEEGRLEFGVTIDETEAAEISKRLEKFDEATRKNFFSYVSGVAKTPVHKVEDIPVKVVPEAKLALTARERQNEKQKKAKADKPKAEAQAS